MGCIHIKKKGIYQLTLALPSLLMLVDSDDPAESTLSRNAANLPLGSGSNFADVTLGQFIHRSGAAVAALGVMKLFPLYECRDSSVKINSPVLHRFLDAVVRRAPVSFKHDVTRGLIKGKV